MKGGKWMLESLEKGLAKLEEEQKNPCWFSMASISNVPYMEYPGFTEEENVEVCKQAQEVLRVSRNKNNYHEVSITYRTDEKGRDKYKIVKGDEDSVGLDMDMIKAANNGGELVVVVLHNHPNNTDFSINDLDIFCENSCIRLMVVVNKEGNLTFLAREKQLDLENLVAEHAKEIVPKLSKRIEEWKAIHGDMDDFSVLDIISEPVYRRRIAQSVLKDVITKGAIYAPYLGEIQAEKSFGEGIVKFMSFKDQPRLKEEIDILLEQIYEDGNDIGDYPPSEGLAEDERDEI